MVKQKTIEEKYQKLTPKEHILKRPDTYIGSITTEQSSMWILNEENKIIEKTISYNPGILKLFDEIITNASDHSRDNPVKKIEITITDDTITVLNDGPGIPIKIHKDHNLYLPQLIFSELYTGSNYDDDEIRIKGGRNGLGSKIVGFFSTELCVETVSEGQKYKQRFLNNLDVTEPPKITNFKGSEYTKISFKPDFKRFDLSKIDEGTFKCLEKRAFDIAACTEKSLSVVFNGQKLGIKDFKEYTKMYLDGRENPVFFETDRWKVAIATSPYEKFTQVSFVNCIHTGNGGKHVEYIANQVIKYLTDKHKKKHSAIKSQYFKENLFILVISLIENPKFQSQSKDELTTQPAKFGSVCELDQKTLKQIGKLELSNKAVEKVEFKITKELSKTDGKKKTKLTGIPKLDDANYAGSKRSRECTLILTEGESAKTFAVAGISEVGGRDLFGIFPLKGKLLNVKTATSKQLVSNEEIKNLKTILGLQNKSFKNADDIRKSMRYGKILILTDQDTDGSHIKGLLINFFHTFWPDLIKDIFIETMQTPIVKCLKGKKIQKFYNLIEYKNYFEQENPNGWKIKYYKGLGTSTSKEAKEAFKEIKDNLSNIFIKDEDDEYSIKLAFDKDKSDERKQWIQSSTGKDLFLDRKQKKVHVKDFINKELISFSIYDCERSIPNLMDGFKPSQRKVLFTCFDINLIKEKKVFELCGAVSDKTSYHHGDKSLNDTIIGMAQDFVGSNNINLLLPQGGFGSRLLGGEDAASPRYIFTELNPITRLIFKKEDDPLLTYLDDDGKTIEPEYFYPVICTLLVNGACGIGTGYSTDIPSHNPKDIIYNIRKLIENPDYMFTLNPWVRGFKGIIEEKEGNKNWISRGVWKRIDRYTIEITELPVKMWTTKYKEHLDKLLETDEISDVKDKGDEVNIHFVITMDALKLNNLISENNIESFFKLETTIKSSNLTYFDENKKLVQVKTTEEILLDFYKVRIKIYKRRYKYLKNKYTEQLKTLSQKILFIERVIDDKIKVFRQDETYVIQQLDEQNFAKVNNSYEYLLSMRISSFTKNKINELVNEKDKIEALLNNLCSKTYKDLWLEDLDELESKL